MALSNHAIRIVVAIIAIPIVLAASYLGGWYFFFFVLTISLSSFYEFSIMSKLKGANPNLFIGALGVVVILLNQYRVFFSIWNFVIFYMALILFVELFRNKGSVLLNVGVTLLGVFYLGLFGSTIIAIREFYPNLPGLYDRGGFIIISTLASIWICDSAAFWSGSSFGKHKLFPRVSPNKSWEGAIFGFVFAILTMIAAKFIILEFLTLKDAILIGVIIGFIGQVGDLVESLIKRDAGVKDSSALIPGHGGMFDRFDSLFFSAPIIYLYLTYIGR
jgi:phosphatidate cytidylyltransferase